MREAILEFDDGQAEIEAYYNIPSIEDEVECKMMSEQVHALLMILTNSKRRIIGLQYGPEGKKRTLEDVGRIFKITRERVRQIEAKALRELQHPSRQKYLKNF